MVSILSTLTDEKQKYLKHLGRQFPSIQEASMEIINLEAILNLPKGTELFLSDLHGEYEAFFHILKNASGVIKAKIEELYGPTVSQKDKRELATLIYYPKEFLLQMEKEGMDDTSIRDWYEVMLHRLILVCRDVSTKYTRSKVRKAMPKGFEYILEELLHQQPDDKDKNEYYDKIVKMVIDIEQADEFICAISELIQRMAIDHLHIIGDIYDRGPGAHIILDKLRSYHSLDIQWGNHDMIWMGAYSGSRLSIANAIRITFRYGNQEIFEEAYGINLLPLYKFAMDNYPEVPEAFYPKSRKGISDAEAKMLAQIHLAISVIMFKLEGQFIRRHPEYEMYDRLILEHIDYEKGIFTSEGKSYEMNYNHFPTISPKQPYKLSAEEQDIIDKLRFSFMHNEKLEKHIDLLFAKGNIYKIHNNNLLFHGCIPMKEDGTFASVKLDGTTYAGKELLDAFERKMREVYANRKFADNENEADIFWYLWTGENSSLFGKKVMKTFERYFIDDKESHEEPKNPYYKLIEDEAVCTGVLEAFGLTERKAKIINGHVPVKVVKGEKPVKANGKLIVIDGGLSKPYQKVTGIAGYTLIYNSYGMMLAAHEPFLSAKDAVENNTDIVSELSVLEPKTKRYRVRDTDIGKALQEDINDLKALLDVYKAGRYR